MKREQAEQVLRIQDPDPSQMQIMKSFRKAAMDAHPDRGGNAEDFHKVVDAKRTMLQSIGAIQSGSGRFTSADLQEGLSAFKNMGFASEQDSPGHREAWYQGHVVTALKSVGAEIYKIHGHAMQVAGIPDLYVGHSDWQGWIEMKAEYGKLRGTQKIKLERLEKRRINAVVFRGFHQMYVVENCKGEPLITQSFQKWREVTGASLLQDLQLCR